MLLRLVRAGADAVKVELARFYLYYKSHSRRWFPQLSAIMNVYQAIKDSKVPIIADGGIRFTGDISKALAAGASSVTMGSMFAGTQESPEKPLF